MTDLYVYIENDVIQTEPAPLPESDKYTSNLYQLTITELEQKGWYKINETLPTFDPVTEMLQYEPPQFDGVTVTRTATIVDQPFEAAQQNKIDQIRDTYEDKCAQGFTTTLGIKVDTMPEDIANWNLGLTMVDLRNDTHVQVCDYYDQLSIVSVDDYRQICLELGNYYQQNLFGTKWQLRQNTLNATTIAELKAIQWPT